MSDFDLNMPEENSSGEEQPWLPIYADMMTLLFAFFVLLYSMSSPDPVKMAGMKDAMAEKAGFEGSMKPMTEIKETIEDIIEEMDIENKANVIDDPRGITLELDGDICFASGKTKIRDSLQSILDKVSQELLKAKGDPRLVIVEGHTDSEPIPANLVKTFPTNWELSGARASAVVRYLISQGVNSGKLQASGYADRWPANMTWFQIRNGEVTDNVIAKENKTTKQKAKNRRIKIIFTEGKIDYSAK